MESALAVRRRIFTAFEEAEHEQDQELREAWLTFVVVGGGPTGIEMAGQIARLGVSVLLDTSVVDLNDHAVVSKGPGRQEHASVDANDRLGSRRRRQRTGGRARRCE